MLLSNKLIKILIPIILLIFSLSLAWYLFQSREVKPVAEISERVWQVEAITLVAGNYSPSLILYGKIEAPLLYKASAPAFGRIEALFVQEGQQVKKGQLLAKMDEADFLPTLKKAQAQVVSLDAQINNEELRYRLDQQALKHQQALLVLGRQSLKRTQEVYRKKLASLSEADDAKKQVLQQQLTINTLKLSLEGYPSRLKSLQASREQALAEQDKAQLSLQRSQFYAPFDGRIASVSVAVGDQLASGQNLFALYPPDQLEIRAKIPFQLKQQIEWQLKQGEALYAVHEKLSNQSDLKHFKLLRLSGQASASGIDAFFLMNKNSSYIRPGSLLQLRFFIPAIEPLFYVPYTALYGKDKLYQLIKDKNNALRMQSIKIKPMGDYIVPADLSEKNSVANNQSLLLFSSDQLKNGDQIVSTHLPNALNGLRVKLKTKVTIQHK